MQDFIFWTWTYPKQVLTTVREQLFHSTLEMFESIGIFLFAIFPLWIRMLRAGPGLRGFSCALARGGDSRGVSGERTFSSLSASLCSAVCASGRGRARSRSARQDRYLVWIGAQYAFGLAVLLVPFSGIFWGTDLVYFDQLSRVMKKSLRPGERVMVWGGSALPLTYTGAEHVTRFVLPRFAVAPYATNETSELFHDELARDIPALILDLHERGDNQFNNPIKASLLWRIW